MATLDTTTPLYLTLEHLPLQLAVLGGIRADGLDRLRVTLKIALVDSPRPPVRHNLDLYHDTQVEKLIRRIAEKLEVGTSVVAEALAALTAALEAYRLELAAQVYEAAATRILLTEQETETAQAFLSTPQLLERTNALIGQSGVIGEEQNRLLLYLIYTSRLREYPLHAVCLAASGTGKTHLQEKVSALIPPEDTIEITTLSENAFYYFGKKELRHKLVLIEDMDGAGDALYPLRELQSKRRIIKTIPRKTGDGDTRALHLVVEGPVSVSGCTTKEQLYEDNATRSFLLHLDDSPQQDERIMQYQRMLSAGKIDRAAEQHAKQLLQNCQRLLEPVTVINPYAEQLRIPESVFKPRRTNAHYLAFIEAVTFYHQYQRKQHTHPDTGAQYIETTLEDIRYANTLLREVLLRKADELSGATRSFLERLKAYLAEKQLHSYASRDVRFALRIASSTFHRYQEELLDNGYIRIVSGKASTGYHYAVTDTDAYAALQHDIENALGAVFQQLTYPGVPPVSHSGSGIHKSKKSKQLKGVSQTSGKTQA